jgi:hypothetical protein
MNLFGKAREDSPSRRQFAKRERSRKRCAGSGKPLPTLIKEKESLLFCKIHTRKKK